MTELKTFFLKKYCTCFSPPLITLLLSNISYLFLYFRKIAFTSLHIYYLRVFGLITYLQCYILIIFYLDIWRRTIVLHLNSMFFQICSCVRYLVRTILFCLNIIFLHISFVSNILEEPYYFALIICFSKFHLFQKLEKNVITLP